MIDNKASNRENYQKQKKHESSKKKFALKEIQYRKSDDLIQFNKQIEENCDCEEAEIPEGQQHLEKCPSLSCVERQRKKEFFRKNYVEFKTTFNYYREYSPEYRLHNWTLKREEYKKDKVGIQQQVVKGKQFKDDHIY